MIEPGKLVVCIDNALYDDFIKLDTPYTCREVVEVNTTVNSTSPFVKFKTAEIGIKIEGIYPNPKIAGYQCQWLDMPFPINDFRELQLPGEIAEILERELQLV